MPTTFAVNAENDMYIGDDGNLAVVTGQDAVLQTCERIAKSMLGEMVLDLDRGIPYKQVIWVGTPNYPAFESALRAEWLEVQGVQEIVSLALSRGINSALNYEAVIRTDYGQGAING